MDEPEHIPVLAKQVLATLNPQPGQVCLDCTVGRAGHASLIVPRLAPSGRFIGLDLDPANVAHARRRLTEAPVKVEIVRANFTQARQWLDRLEIDAVDLLLADLGFASPQMADPARGLSFNLDGPLDMRLDPDLPRTAADLVNETPQHELADLIFQYGQERRSRRIAEKIVEHRRQTPIYSTSQLARIVRRAYGHQRTPTGSRRTRHRRIDPATRTFMALRIAVNRELESLQGLLDDLPQLVRTGGRAAIISFHSLEDRPVKQTLVALRRAGRAVWVNPRPLVADPLERRYNPRSRSAKLRVIRLQDAACD